MKKFWIIILIIILINIVITLSNVLILAINHGEDFIMWNFGEVEKNSSNIRKDEKIEISDINNLNINVKSSDIKLILTDDEELRVVQYSNKEIDDNYMLEINKNNTNIEINEKKINVWYRFNIFNIYNIVYEIYIPKKYNNNLNLISVSGNIYLEDEIMAQKVHLESVSGEIQLKNNLKVNDIKLKSVSGDIETQNIESENIEIEAVSGNIETGKIIGKLKVKTTSGDIKVESLIGKSNLKTTSGDILINDFTILDESSICSTSGDLNIYLNKESNCNINTKTTSGDIKLQNGKNVIGNEPYNILKLETISGDINTK